MNKKELCYLPAFEIIQMIRSQEKTVIEITEAVIERITEINPIINAFCTPTFDIARQMAKNSDLKIKNQNNIGILEGIPTSIKDETETKDIRTTFGSKLFENFIPEEDAIVVKRLKDEGIVILGKTNTPAFGYKGVTDNVLFGSTKNPWDITKTPGGSSGGAASSIASGLGYLAQGSDGGGSIRIPASFCGVYGFKPTFGRIPQHAMKGSGNMGTLVHKGPIVRYVKDAALMLDAMVGSDDSDRYSLPKPNYSYYDKIEDSSSKLRIGVSIDLGFVKVIEPDVKKAVLDAAEKLTDLGWIVENNNNLQIKDADKVLEIMWFSGFSQSLSASNDKSDEALSAMTDIGQKYTLKDSKWAELQREEVYAEICRHFKEYDILITPTLSCTAFKLGWNYAWEIDGKDMRDDKIGWQHFTYPFNLSGHPAASIPCGWDKKGLPIGMQIIGRRLDDLSVLQVSKAFEEICPWQNKKPIF